MDDPKKIDGRKLAREVRSEIKREVENFINGGRSPPSVGVILVGDRKDSDTYVRMKHKACEEVGMKFILHRLSDDATEDQIIAKVKELNEAHEVDGVLVQLPLPARVNEKRVLMSVDINKDVDGFHPELVGQLALKNHSPALISCTPRACIEILERENVELEGKNVVVIGRSNIVGLPLFLLLLERNCTPTICHSRTVDIAHHTRQADVVIAAVGKAEMVKKDWIKPGAVCIDVGMNDVEDSTKKRGYRLTGDMDYNGCKEVASKISPVPGGVGPMTVAMLLKNTLDSALRRRGGGVSST